MNSDYGVWKLLKASNPEQWRKGGTWLWYTVVGVALPLVFSWFGHLQSGEIASSLELLGDGELYIYSASFWVYALYSLDQARLPASMLRSIPYVAIALLSSAFAYLQQSADPKNLIIYLSIGCFVASVLMSYFGNLIYRSKAALEDKAKYADYQRSRQENRSALTKKIKNLGGIS